jgi:hypothetical protein
MMLLMKMPDNAHVGGVGWVNYQMHTTMHARCKRAHAQISPIFDNGRHDRRKAPGM